MLNVGQTVGIVEWAIARSRRLDKDWVPQTGQGIIYGVVLGAVEWTELEGVASAIDWTELRLVEKEKQQ